jgi:UDP-glucose 4-epimerase
VVFGDGQQTRDFIYVGDAVNAYLAAADRGRPGIWNVGSGAEVSILQLAAVISEVSGHEMNPVFGAARPGELRRGALASERARRDLGWEPTVSLADGVGRVYRWIEAGAPEQAGW